MSTNGTITLKVKPEDIGKTLQFDINKIPKGFKYSSNYLSKVGKVKITKGYLTVYHHWDSYIEDGLGQRLLEHYNDYDTILNIILGGDISTLVNDEIIQYTAWRDEDWGRCKPEQTDECPMNKQEYGYKFEDGIWYVSYRGGAWQTIEKELRAKKK